jgi:hypothetical protein
MPTPLLIVAGIQLKPQVSGADRGEPIVQGATERSFSGRLLSTVHATEKHEWTFTIKPMTPEEVAELRAAIKASAYVSVGGRFISDVTTNAIDAVVQIKSAKYVPGGAAGVYREVLTLTIQEA